MERPVIELKNLKVTFRVSRRDKVTAIEDVSFAIDAGKTLGVVGESGCGKSVTANAILNLLPRGVGKIEQGEVLLNGTDLTKLPSAEMRKIRGGKISMIFQEPMTSLNPVQRIGDQLVEMYKAKKRMKKSVAWESATQMLEKVGIPSPAQRMKEYPYQLSGGMRQRVMIAMALSSNPELLIADEPTTALDVTIQAQVLELMKSLQREMNTAILLITHDMGVVAETADYVMVMYAGEAVEYDSARAIFQTPLHPYTQGLLKSIPRKDQDVDELYTIEGTVPALTDMPAGCRFSTRCPDRMERCLVEKPKLTMCGGRMVRCWKYVSGGVSE